MDMIKAGTFSSPVPLEALVAGQDSPVGQGGPAAGVPPREEFAPDLRLDVALAAGASQDVEAGGLLEKAASFQRKADQPPQSHVPSKRDVAAARIREAGKCMETAAKAGVDITRSTFLRKVVGAVASVIALGVMVAATLATGGAAAPALAVACLSTLSYAGDAVCAWREWKNAQADAAGQFKPYAPLPCGPSAVGNLAFWAVRGQCKDDAAALSVAHKVELGFSLGLLAFSLATCVVPPELQLAQEALKFVSLGLKSMMYLQATLTGAGAHEPDADTGLAQGPGLGEELDQAVRGLDEALGNDPKLRHALLQDLLRSGESEGGDAYVSRVLRSLLDKEGKLDPQKAGHLLTKPVEHARHGTGPAWEKLVAVGVSVACTVLVGMELPPGGGE